VVRGPGPQDRDAKKAKPARSSTSSFSSQLYPRPLPSTCLNPVDFSLPLPRWSPVNGWGAALWLGGMGYQAHHTPTKEGSSSSQPKQANCRASFSQCLLSAGLVSHSFLNNLLICTGSASQLTTQCSWYH
jgi:hypothetical protein